MAGSLPGVGVSPRRRMHHHYQEDSFNHREPSLRERLDPLITASTMDETTLRARQRLEKKLGYFKTSSRSSKTQPDEVRAHNSTVHTKHTRSGSKLLGRPWHFQLNRSKSHRKVCAVCLEDFQAEQQVMDLSCSHKYHSNCLLPWLESHPHCPYCRSPIQS